MKCVNYRKCVYGFLLIVLAIPSHAQKTKSNGKPQGRYPSVFWEITGNGLTKPSYLFGTMHVSSKLAFHLSDSFYNAIQACDMVALELSPREWQSDMMEMNEAQRNYSRYHLQSFSGDFIRETSFQLNDYYKPLEEALTSKPQQINGLLYRNNDSEQDYEEDTYLDLHIYQTGRKFGKLAGGVENYKTMQSIISQAYVAAYKEKNTKVKDTDGESSYDIRRKIQEAYRKGDLDALDSLSQFESRSPAYDELFLYKRNEIQAEAIIGLLKQRSVFTGVGAAHLPGPRGVIELLRKAGFKLRPIFMQDRDAARKDSIERMRVPVVFQQQQTEDKFVTLNIPGKLYALNNSFTSQNRLWQYADMENGAYYMLTRVSTHAGLLGQSTSDVMEKIDSLLYENIPGKILSKKEVMVSGYSGFDIRNRTRRGDLQRYKIAVTPFEILVFKMSGTNDYVEGTEATIFFNSIQIQPPAEKNWKIYNNGFSGFEIMMPHQPFAYLNNNQVDNLGRWEFESTDDKTGHTYFVWKKTIINYEFLEEDSFDVSLIEESFKSSNLIENQTSRKTGKLGAYKSLRMSFEMKEGSVIEAMALVKGCDYYLVGERIPKRGKMTPGFLPSFKVALPVNRVPKLFIDTLTGYSVQTSFQPSIDTFVAQLVSDILNDKQYMDKVNGTTYWQDDQYKLIYDDSTGQQILMVKYDFPKYFAVKDSATFWKNQLDEEINSEDWILQKKEFLTRSNSAGYHCVWTDTNTVRKFESLRLLKDNRMLSVFALSDSADANEEYINQFFSTFTLLDNNWGPSVFEPKIDSFFSDLYSTDSITRERSRAAIKYITFGSKDIDRIFQYINSLKYGEDDYFEMKRNLIAELGFIKDSCCTDKVVSTLLKIYQQTADTGYFQNEVLQALAHLQTANSYHELKKILIHDPPVFESDYIYHDFFESMKDSLILGKILFPEILNLSSISEYEEPVLSLLGTLLDSGYITGLEYRDHYNRMWVEARIEMKKQQNEEERMMESETQIENNPDTDVAEVIAYSNQSSNDIDLYARLMMPFYNSDTALHKFYNRLLTGRDTALQIATAIQMVKENILVPDEVWKSIASKDKFRFRLLRSLHEDSLDRFFPSKDFDQQDLALSALLYQAHEDSYEEIQMVGKEFITIKEKSGWVYFFKYKMKDDEDWQMGISGIQPENLKKLSSDDSFVSNTDKKLTEDKPALLQFQRELRKLIISARNSGVLFFQETESYDSYYEE